jgi:hypothetical protein
MNLRSEFNVYLVGHSRKEIRHDSSKLPSNRDVLSVLFYKMRVEKLSFANSATLVLNEIQVFWQKARIPTKPNQHCIAHIRKLYTKWQNLHKRAKVNTSTQKKKEKEFQDDLENLFDIAHGEADTLIQIPEDREFLRLQRQQGRIGFMAAVDEKLAEVEERRAKRETKFAEHKKRKLDEVLQSSEKLFYVKVKE